MSAFGIGDDVRMEWSEVALVQLREAIELLGQQKYLSAITLAGAAEEILGNMLKSRGESSSVAGSLELIAKARALLKTGPLNGRTEKQLVTEWNRARNSLKHFDPAAPVVVFNPIEEAYIMVGRALNNAKSLSLAVTNSHEYESWVIRTITMPDEHDV